MKKRDRKPLLFVLIVLFVAQFIFLLFSGRYTTPKYEAMVFATTGILFDGADLHKLNEGAHYFGQTMIGWTKFPSFHSNLIKFTGLPEGSSINMHAQERQNFVFTIDTSEPIEFETLSSVKDFLQLQLDEYNEKTNTHFVLTNVDYEQLETTRNYWFGALFTLLLSGALALGALFVRKEFFPPKLKL